MTIADEDEILRCAQDDTVKQLRGMRITAEDEILRCAQDDRPALRMTGLRSG